MIIIKIIITMSPLMRSHRQRFDGKNDGGGKGHHGGKVIIFIILVISIINFFLIMIALIFD